VRRVLLQIRARRILRELLQVRMRSFIAMDLSELMEALIRWNLCMQLAADYVFLPFLLVLLRRR
jgi:hypothetical protein